MQPLHGIRATVGCTLVLAILLAAIVLTTERQNGQQHDDHLDELVTSHRQEHEGNDHRQLLLVDDYQTSSLLEKFQMARAKFMEKLDEDYGSENVRKIFQTKTVAGGTVPVTHDIFNGTSESWSRMRRKVAMKILKAQIQQKPEPFVWATGGHSAAAAHGNLLDESYTAVLEKGSHPIFEAVGLDFTARNYAMGGTSCGMEIASCVKEVFGSDIDVLSWDYGMTTAVSIESS